MADNNTSFSCDFLIVQKSLRVSAAGAEWHKAKEMKVKDHYIKFYPWSGQVFSCNEKNGASIINGIIGIPSMHTMFVNF